MNTLFVGTYGSGKTLALNTLASEAEAAGSTVHKIGFYSPGTVAFLLEGLVSELGARTSNEPILVVVDDLDSLTRKAGSHQRAVQSHLLELARNGGTVGITVAASAEYLADAQFLSDLREAFTVKTLPAASNTF